MRYSFYVGVTLVMVALGLEVRGHGFSNRDRLRPVVAIEPPKRPASFNSMDELNNYLEDIKQYYTLLGRPRFGRSTSSRSSQPSEQEHGQS